MPSDICQSLTSHLSSRYHATFEPDDNLFASGVIDSAGFAELVVHLGTEYGVTLEPSELVEENFQTIATIARLVASKRG